MRTDKGNATVPIDKHIYISKMTNLLNNTNTYLTVNKNSTKKLINELHCLLSKWKKKSYISDIKYKSLNCTDGVLPIAYGLPKIHKPDCFLRINVSSVNTPIYNFVQWMGANKAVF